MNKVIVFILISICLICCERERQIDLNFPNSINVNFKSLTLYDSVLINPTQIIAYDSLLLIKDEFEGKILTVINLNDIENHLRLVNKGKGPNEFLGGYLGRVNDTIFQIADVSSRKISTINLFKLLKNHHQSNTVIFDSILYRPKGDEFVLNAHFVNSSDILGLGSFVSNRYIFYNGENRDISFKGNYPKDERKEHDNEKNLTKYWAYQGNFLNNSKYDKTICYSPASYYFDIISFVEGDFSIDTTVIFNKPLYKRDADGSATFSRKNKMTFSFSDSNDDEIFLLYLNRSFEEHQSDFFYGNEIHVYDWNGNKKYRLILDKQIKALTYCKYDNRIYGLTENEKYEPTIVYFELK